MLRGFLRIRFLVIGFAGFPHDEEKLQASRIGIIVDVVEGTQSNDTGRVGRREEGVPNHLVPRLTRSDFLPLVTSPRAALNSTREASQTPTTAHRRVGQTMDHPLTMATTTCHRCSPAVVAFVSPVSSLPMSFFIGHDNTLEWAPTKAQTTSYPDTLIVHFKTI